MRTIYSEDHALHSGNSELVDDKLQPSFECPERATRVLDGVLAAGLGEVVPPEDYGAQPLERVHDRRYLTFLETAWDQWNAAGRSGNARPFSWAIRGMRQIEPEHIDGKLAFFSSDIDSSITSGTWQAAKSAANVALTGATQLLDGEPSAFSLCRPPGHHAAADYFGGYCFLNNAAIAAQYLRDRGAERVAVLDIDYHHGNGTQSIFYTRADVLFVSIHGDPRQEYPFFLGHADETGSGDGEGYNLNLPLRWQSPATDWFDALATGLTRIAGFKASHLVVSLGVDTFIDDPISEFRLETPDYLEVGAQIASLGLPSLYVLEGGYAIGDIGTNVANVLVGASRTES